MMSMDVNNEGEIAEKKRRLESWRKGLAHKKKLIVTLVLSTR